MVGRTLGSEAVGAGVYVALVWSSDGAMDGRTGNEGAALGVGELWSMTMGTAVTSTFIATNTPAMPMPMIMKTGTVSRARSPKDFCLSLIGRVCRTQPRRAAAPLGAVTESRARRPADRNWTWPRASRHADRRRARAATPEP